MGHLGLFIVVASLTWRHLSGAAGHSLPACQEKLEFRCNDGSCIPIPTVCDGHTNCEDGSDERHCGHLWCKKDEFACSSSRRCIPTRFLCNSVDDCGDGSDETSCQKCTADFFPCGPSDACLPKHKLCDGRKDCKDGRDEAEGACGLVCPASQFQCGDGKCISQSWRCDHSADCSDGSDEKDCDQDECRVNNGGCSHWCVDMEMGFHCDCPENMKLVGNSQCEEVDVCLESDVCDQLCVHMNGSLTCACHEGYQMSAITGECKAKGDAAELVVTTSKEIRWMSITGTEYRQLAPHLTGLGPVAALASNRTLYWAQQGRGSIYSISMDGKLQDAALVLNVQGSLSGLAVDWIHHLLYWTSMETGSVDVGLLDGSAQRRLITGLDKPSAVAVDPLQGLLFWAQCGSSPNIERASLDGRDRMALVTSLIRHPVALCLDIPRQLLYWADERMRSISRVNYEGHHRKTVIESNGYLDRPFGLAVFEGFVYWSDEVTHSICRADKHDGVHLQVLLTNVTSPRGVVISQPALQPTVNGSSQVQAVCGRTGAVCQHKCVFNLTSETPGFICTHPEATAISHAVPASDLSDPAFAGILSLIVFLSVLLVGIAVWWWREEFRHSRTLTLQSLSLMESHDLLIQATPTDPNIKETLLKLDFDGE
ncbi:hypothetical protein PAMA_001206 [Pampus argenteus]